MSYYPSPLFRQRFFDANGVPLAGGQLCTYAAGTTNPQTTYSNSTGTTNTNPVILDSTGYADVWLDPTIAYKFVLQDSLGNNIWTVDNVTAPLGVSTYNSNISYTQGSIVTDTSGYGLIYVSLTSGNQGNALSNTSFWRIFDGNVRTLSSNTSLLVTDNLIKSNSTGGSLTHTLPACSATPIGKRITIKDVGTGGNTTTVQGAGSDKIDGSSSYSFSLTEYDTVTIENDGTSWNVINVVPNVSVTTAKIASQAVTAAKIANNTITASQIANNTITATQIANQTITSTQIANTTITASQIANATITGAQIASSTITAAKCSKNNVSSSNAGSNYSGTTPSGVSGLTNSITPTGGAVLCIVQGSYIISSTGQGAFIKVRNTTGGYDVGVALETTISGSVPLNFTVIDPNPTAGTAQSYQVQVYVTSGDTITWGPINFDCIELK